MAGGVTAPSVLVVQVLGASLALVWLMLVVHVFVVGQHTTTLETTSRTHHLKNVFHPRSQSLGKLEILEQYKVHPLHARGRAASVTQSSSSKHQVPDTAEWSIISAPHVSKQSGRQMPPRPFMGQPEAPDLGAFDKSMLASGSSAAAVPVAHAPVPLQPPEHTPKKKIPGAGAGHKASSSSSSSASAPHPDLGTGTTANGASHYTKGSGSHVSANELQWPPMNKDKSFPISDGFEIMPITEMKVPRFWELPKGQDPVKATDFVNGQETIFLMIASYRDFQCHETITSAFSRADHPERLYVGAVDQVVAGDMDCLYTKIPCSEDPTQMICKYRDQISIFNMNAGLATGPVTARHIGDRMYRGQHFVMQMDAHCWFVRHWDTLIIGQWRSTKNEMAVLSSYLTDIQGSIDSKGDSTRNTRPIMCNSDFEGMMPQRYLRHGSQPEDVSPIHDMPQLQPFWAAGFSFSRGHFKLRVPYDAYQPMVFQGEEISCGIRGFTYGYDFYAPMASVVFHEYAERSNRRKKVKLFWENSGKHKGEGQKSLKRSMAIIGMAPDIDPALWNHEEESRYGLGTVRPVSQFYELFLIDPLKRKATQLCPFVKNGKMHHDFQPHLRADGLGIDYSALKSYDTAAALEKVFESQRPAGRSWLQTAITRKSRQGIQDAMANARKIGLDRTDKALFNQAEQALGTAH